MIGTSRPTVSIQQAIVNVMQRAGLAQSAGGRLLGIPSGFREIDRITLGWQNQDLIFYSSFCRSGSLPIAHARSGSPALPPPTAVLSENPL